MRQWLSMIVQFFAAATIMFAFVPVFIPAKSGVQSTPKAVVAQRAAYISHWQKEANASLGRNIRIGCKTRVVSGLSMPPSFSDTFYVSTSHPSRMEVNTFQKLPTTLTRSNPEITANAIKKGYGYDKWASEKGERWEVPSDHEGQNRSNCFDLTALAGKGNTLDVYRPYKNVQRAFYLLRNTNAVIHPSGSTAFDCGYFMGYEGCETKWDQAHDWWRKCVKTFGQYQVTWRDLWSSSASSAAQHQLAMTHVRNCSIRWDILDQPQLNGSYIYAPKHFRRVFVVSAVWDYNYHHFVADCLARMARHLRFLQANPDVYIHLRLVEEYEIRSEEFKRFASDMRLRLFSLLGIVPSRLVWGIVLAEEVYIPRNLHCGYTLSNPTEIRLLASELLTASRRNSSKSSDPVLTHAGAGRRLTHHADRDTLYIDPKHGVRRRSKKKYLIVQQRYTSWGSSDREWNDETFNFVVEAFTKQYPNHTVVRSSSRDVQAPGYCMSCEMVQFSKADIFVAAHGAGMTNIMFMPPSSLVVEIFGDIKDVNMPLCGYYGPLSAIVGAHHFLYSYDHGTEKLDATKASDAAAQSFKFYMDLRTQNRSALNVLRIEKSVPVLK